MSLHSALQIDSDPHLPLCVLPFCRDFERKDPTFKGIVFSQWTSFLNIIQASHVVNSVEIIDLGSCSLS